MNKMDDAWAVMQQLPQREQELAADAILDFAANLGGPRLTGEQVAEVERRLGDTAPKSATPVEVRARLGKPGL